MILSRLITPAPDRSLGHLVQQKYDADFRVDFHVVDTIVNT